MEMIVNRLQNATVTVINPISGKYDLMLRTPVTTYCIQFIVNANN